MDEILLAALQAFAERGYDGMSLRDLNTRLGVSHNLIFQRLGRKEDVWRAVVDHYFGHLTAGLIDAAESTDGTTAQRLAALRAILVDFIVANAARPELLRMMAVEASIESDRLSYLFERYIEPTTLSVGRVFQSLVDEGALHDLPPGTLFFLIAHGATAPAGHAPLARRVGVQDGSDPVVALRHAEAVVDAILAGLQPRGR